MGRNKRTSVKPTLIVNEITHIVDNSPLVVTLPPGYVLVEVFDEQTGELLPEQGFTLTSEAAFTKQYGKRPDRYKLADITNEETTTKYGKIINSAVAAAAKSGRCGSCGSGR